MCAVKEEGVRQEASVNRLMKKNNITVKASQEQVKHGWRGGLRAAKAKGQNATWGSRAGLDFGKHGSENPRTLSSRRRAFAVL